jgi:hypothetical protein
MPTKLTAEILHAAIEGLEAQKSRIDARIAEIQQMLSDGGTEPAAPPELPKRKRKMSAAARKRIGDAQRKRWAEAKRESEPPSQPATSEAPKSKRKMSAAGRKRIIAANQKRWAAIHAAEQAEKPAVAKKAAARKAGGKKTAAKKSPVKVAKKAAKGPEPAETAA